MAGRTLGVADAEPTLDSLTVTGATTFTGASTNSGATTHTGASTFGSTVGVTGNITASGAISVAGSAAVTGALTVTATAIFNGNADICNSATDLLGFHGTAGCDQSTTVSAVTTTGAVAVSGTLVYGFETAAQADLIVTAVNSLRTCLREKGLMA